MAEVLRVVSGPVSSRTTIVDLLSAVNVLSSFSAPAPRLRRASASSFQADGSVDAATAWDDRELTITFAVQGSSEDQAAFVSQILGRTFSRPCWLEFQGGTSKPVFFRTRATTLDAVEDFGPSNPGVRLITVVVPADPFAYGLPESGTATVPNDPTSANGMRFTISNVRGDVPAALQLSLGFSANTARILVGASNHAALDHAAALESGISASGWTASSPSDATAIGGTSRRLTGSSGAAASVGFTIGAFSLLPGDYRVMVRAKSATSGVRLAMRHPLTGALIGSSVDVSSTGWQWTDLGVFRLPVSSRQASAWTPSVPGDAQLTVTALVATPSASSVIDLDHVVLVPAPGGDTETGRLLLGRWQPMTAVPDVASAQVDAAEILWSSLGSGYEVMWSSAGGFPIVTPGANNLVTVMSWLAAGDAKGSSTTVNWSYHPRYLTLRGD